jgi:hypothetical protein
VNIIVGKLKLKVRNGNVVNVAILEQRKKRKKMEIKFAPEFKKSIDKMFSMNPIYSIPRWFTDTRYKIKWAYQRVFRGWDDRWRW